LARIFQNRFLKSAFSFLSFSSFLFLILTFSSFPLTLEKKVDTANSTPVLPGLFYFLLSNRNPPKNSRLYEQPKPEFCPSPEDHAQAGALASSQPRALPEFFTPQASSYFWPQLLSIQYYPFYDDFGPNNLGQLVTFCRVLDSRLQFEENRKHKLYFVTKPAQHDFTNNAYLICCYLV
jgi:hypothetical protein